MLVRHITAENPKMIDLYAERIAPGCWGEPFNTVTNLAFFMAAFAALRLARHRNGLAPCTGALVTLCLLISIGSTLFHMFATPWAMALDVIPIMIFQMVFLACYTRKIIRLPWPVVLLLEGLFVSFSMLLSGSALLNGSMGYLPSLFFLTALGLIHRKHAQKEPNLLLYAAGVLFLSLTCRTLDFHAATFMPWGSHFLWHLLNGLLLYLVMRAMIVNTPDDAQSRLNGLRGVLKPHNSRCRQPGETTGAPGGSGGGSQ
jgi:hypothetical protein